ncbi:glycoside hydrolase family 88 protein [Alkalihalobacterium chitinilyticum]|uniref:Glycoside hydrolase family 88 protein n=1 Tax=Alkalihalobacterium chitinilyticum TaxID=2980103 RepID=A0ABT5VEA9_9BACI|nr:glycoside hydrolase family 88 protein [Alkalihalobacterium chitinilyticum]MDE5413797.1 glycoside hydrolase family 88 protein [Alkalihalobacterium chitinilyticum]
MTLLLISLLTIFSGIIIIILIDIIPIFKDWAGRIHIGRFTSKESWNKAIVSRGIQWLNHTPKIKVTDNTRLVFIDMLKGNYSKDAIQHWQEAALLLGLIEYLRTKDDAALEKEINQFLNRKFDQSGQWIEKPEHVDGAILAYAVIKLNHIETGKYKKAFDYTWNLIKEHIGEDGTVGYRKSMMDYRYVDTIGFICPFLVAYGLKYQIEECIDLAVKQIKEYEQWGMLEGHFIPCHAYKVKNKAPLGLYGWGRGLGWYAIGLIDAWGELPQDHPSKDILEESVKKFARAAMNFQQDNGSWNWTVTRNESRPDSSATATLSWFLINAAKIEGISEECQSSTRDSIKYFMSVTRRNGTVDFSQGDTKDIGVYSSIFNKLPFTQGFCIRLLASYKKRSSSKC